MPVSPEVRAAERDIDTLPHYGNTGHPKSGWELIFGQSYRVALMSFFAECPKSSGWSMSAWHHSDTGPVAEREAANWQPRGIYSANRVRSKNCTSQTYG